MRKEFLKKLNVLLAVALIAVFTACLVACEETNPSADGDDRPQLVIACDEYPPFFFMDEDGEFSGIDVEIAKLACDKIGYKAVFKKISWSDKDALLYRGEIDCIWGCFTMTGREDRYEWVGPYMKSRHVVGVLASSDIYTLADLGNKNVAVQATSKADEILSAHDDPRIPTEINLYGFTDFEIMFASLDNGYVDAIASHNTIMAEYMRENESKYRVLDEALLEVNLGAAFLKGSTREVITLLNGSVRELISDGTVAEIATKYGLDPEKVLAL